MRNILPEKWCIQVDEENEEILHQWYVANIKQYKDCLPEWCLGKGGFFHFPQLRPGLHTASSDIVSKGYEVIIFSEFKTLALDETQEFLIFN